MSGQGEGARLRVLPPLTEDQRIDAAKAELAQIGARIRRAVLDGTPASRYDGKAIPTEETHDRPQ